MYRLCLELDNVIVDEDGDQDFESLRVEDLVEVEDVNQARHIFEKILSFGIPEVGNIGDAVNWLNAGYRVRRGHWTDGVYWEKSDTNRVMLHRPHRDTLIAPIHYKSLLATDWTVYDGEAGNV